MKKRHKVLKKRHKGKNMPELPSGAGLMKTQLYRNTDSCSYMDVVTSVRTLVIQSHEKKNIPFGFHLSYFGSAAQVRHGEKKILPSYACVGKQCSYG